MKKQINPNIKAHLIRGAFYLLLLVAVCAIPFALAQRNGTRRTNIRGVPHLPQRSLTTGFSNAYGTVPLVFKKSLIAPFLLNRPIGCPAVITQSTSNVIEQGDSVSCNNGLESTENHYWRAFNMNDFTGGLAYTTTSLDMGIEQATSGGITLNSITVNIYSNHGSAFPGGDWQSNLVGTSGPIDIPDQSLTYPVNIPVTATVEAGALELVLEVVGADGQGLGNLMFIGANSSAETGLSYVSAADCGITDPTPTGDVGFPDTHWVFNVNGGCGGASPTPTPTGSPSCTPIVIMGSIADPDPTQIDKLVASGFPQTCPASTTCAIFGDPHTFRYDAYTFTNTTGATQCVTIDTNTQCNGNHNIFTAAYLGSFDPNNICTNWIGDSGTFPNPDSIFHVDVPAGQMFVVVVSEYHHAGCPGYTLTITGLCGGGTPTPTPTASPTCTPGGGTPGPWTQAAPVAVDHYGGFMDSDGTFGYEGGGYSFSVGDNINNFARFDPVANTWTPLAAVPDLNNSLASGVYAPNVNKLFVFGGENVNAVVVVNTTRIYDIATNTWSTGAPMPDVRAFMASGYFNGKIYLVGGYSTGNVDPSFGQVWEYDPVTNTFDTSRTDMPATLGGPGFGVINGHLYVAGGRDINNTNLNTLYDYDIAADSWTQRANIPGAGTNVPASAVIGGKLWIFGGGNPFRGSAAIPSAGKQGEGSPDTTNILQVYDPGTDSWTTGPSLNQIRSFPAGTDVGNTAVAVGGYTGTDTTTSVEVNVTSGGSGCSPTPTPTATAPTATPTATATGTAPSATPTATATTTATGSPTATATATPTSTARPTPTPRTKPTPRPAPTPGPRPTIKPSPWPPPSPTP